MKESVARVRILETASRLFYDQGYNSTGISQIIEEADISRQSLYNHFPSKRDLLLAYIEHAESAWFERLEKFLKKYKDPKSKLLGIFDFRADEQYSTGFRGCHFSKIMAEVPKDDLEIFEHVSKEKDRMKTFIKVLLGQIELKNPSLDIDMICEAMFLLFEGCTVAASLYKVKAPIAYAKKITASLL
ncbi:MAG TPA: TetR/AcrR family transcriptional regulator [Puia sp.]|jgi:AcrR family transcriptional regulator